MDVHHPHARSGAAFSRAPLPFIAGATGRCEAATQQTTGTSRRARARVAAAAATDPTEWGREFVCLSACVYVLTGLSQAAAAVVGRERAGMT